MFPTRESRFRTAFRRSLDAAIEFATLGEYGWSAAWEGCDGAVAQSATPASAGFGGGFPPPVAGTAEAPTGGGTAVAERPSAALLRPASAAGRARKNAEVREAPCCSGQHLRSRALEAQLPRPARSRDGMAPREQRCTADATA